MTPLAAARAGMRMAAYHPRLMAWFIRNRLRLRSLPGEQQDPSGRSSRPVGITLKPTFSCNLRCSMCAFVANGAVFTHPRDSLPLDVWLRLVDDVAEWRPYIWFTGGEPTLYPDFIPLVRAIKDRGMLCGVTTNGTTLRQRADEIVENPMDLMVVSVDGRGEVHNRVRGNPRVFGLVEEGIAALNEAKRRRRSARPALVINCALTPDSFERADEMVDVAMEFGAEALNYQHLWQMTDAMIAAHNERWEPEHRVDPAVWGGSGPSGMDPTAVTEVVRRVKAKRANIPVLFHPELSAEETRVYYEEPEVFVRRRPAACAWLNTDVLPNGDVSPCFDVVCGNITTSRFTDLWNGEDFRSHRVRLARDGEFPICARCCAYWRRD